jgi:hypothetical protein
MMNSKGRPFRVVLPLCPALVALFVAAAARAEGSGDACGRTCAEAKRACATSATTERRSCYRECKAAEGSADQCHDQCRSAYSEDKEQCKSDLRQCRDACSPSDAGSPCLDACRDQRRQCVEGREEAKGSRGCSRGCVIQGREARAKCGAQPEGNCHKQAADELSACLRSCTDSKRGDQTQCRATFRECAQRCDVAKCGGIEGTTCPAGQNCVDDPADDCDPAQGGADCGGICVTG